VGREEGVGRCIRAAEDRDTLTEVEWERQVVITGITAITTTRRKTKAKTFQILPNRSDLLTPYIAHLLTFRRFCDDSAAGDEFAFRFLLFVVSFFVFSFVVVIIIIAVVIAFFLLSLCRRTGRLYMRLPL